MRYSYNVAVRCRKGHLKCLTCARKDKGVKRKKLRKGENSRVLHGSTSLCIIIMVNATVWFMRNQFCRIQIYRFTVE